MLALCYLCLALLPESSHPRWLYSNTWKDSTFSRGGDESHEVKTVGAKVPLEAHVMSKCPDARDCLRDLVVPAMEQVADMVDFRLSFIGR